MITFRLISQKGADIWTEHLPKFFFLNLKTVWNHLIVVSNHKKSHICYEMEKQTEKRKLGSETTSEPHSSISICIYHVR